MGEADSVDRKAMTLARSWSSARRRRSSWCPAQNPRPRSGNGPAPRRSRRRWPPACPASRPNRRAAGLGLPMTRLRTPQEARPGLVGIGGAEIVAGLALLGLASPAFGIGRGEQGGDGRSFRPARRRRRRPNPGLEGVARPVAHHRTGDRRPTKPMPITNSSAPKMRQYLIEFERIHSGLSAFSARGYRRGNTTPQLARAPPRRSPHQNWRRQGSPCRVPSQPPSRAVRNSPALGAAIDFGAGWGS